MNKIVKPPVRFTKDMVEEYTLLIPDMNHIHFKILRNVFVSMGYKVEVLYNQSRAVVDEGLKYVHNDTCYPALLVIGQMIDALKSGNYDTDKTALMITQTGGGCRASNYIHLLRHALEAAGFGHVPVVSLNFSGLEKDSGFQITIPAMRKALAAVAYGDLLMLLDNQVKPYECNVGDSAALTDKWVRELSARFEKGSGYAARVVKRTFREIVQSYGDIPRRDEKKVRVGIVGEIYVKYAALGNNNLEQFLYEQGCEVMVPGLMDFLLYSIFDSLFDRKLYGSSWLKTSVYKIVYRYVCDIKREMNRAVAAQPGFVAPSDFEHVVHLAQDVIGHGCKMGEGWLLTAEIMELVELGYANVICVQPFGCLPNHIIGKGMSRKIKGIRPQANIVPIDYDPGATKVNQENRIKLMLEVARENMNGRQVTGALDSAAGSD